MDNEARQKLFDLLVSGAGDDFYPDPNFFVPPKKNPWEVPFGTPVPFQPSPYSGDTYPPQIPIPFPVVESAALRSHIMDIRALLNDLSWTEKGCWCSTRNISDTDHSQTCQKIGEWMNATKHLAD